MIKYRLVCGQAHEFEGWFQTSHAFDAQSKDGLVSCPICDSRDVRRALMAPNLASPKRQKAAREAMQPMPAKPTPPATSPVAGGQKPVPAKPVNEAAALAAYGAVLAELRQIQRKIQDECRYVGDDFADEVRKIHYGETEPENIYGQSTVEEYEELADEGIDVTPMPWLPPEQ
jgi:hypothetical protein